MKKITTLLLIMFLTSHALFAQTKDDWLKKSGHQKTAAWILVGGGTGLLVVGSLSALFGVVDIAGGQNTHKLDAATVLIIAGGASVLGSIPLFMAASKNKHKAMNISFTSQSMPALVKNIIGSKPVPSVRLQLNL